MRLLQGLSDRAEVILCIYAGDIEKKKMRADFGITYDADALKLMDDLGERGVPVTAVVITRYEGQPGATAFKAQLENRGVQVRTHRFTKGYPTDVDTVVSDEGYGANSYVETEKPIVVVTGPGPGSGKLATCLSQLYHDRKRGLESGYAKFETFPIWNLPLKHPVNSAYEAATAEMKDVNQLDHFHLEAYDERAVNYNRDIQAFPLLRRIVERITGQSYYDYVRENIYEPAGMTSSGHHSMECPVENLAIGYYRPDDGSCEWKNNYYERLIAGSPAGGGYSTAPDLHRFTQAILSEVLVSKETLESLEPPGDGLPAPALQLEHPVEGPLTPEHSLDEENRPLRGETALEDRPTKRVTLHLQVTGEVIRLVARQEAMLTHVAQIDLVGTENRFRHGFRSIRLGRVVARELLPVAPSGFEIPTELSAQFPNHSTCPARSQPGVCDIFDL